MSPRQGLYLCAGGWLFIAGLIAAALLIEIGQGSTHHLGIWVFGWTLCVSFVVLGVYFPVFAQLKNKPQLAD